MSISAGEAADRLRGIALMCAAVFLFAILDTSAKYAGRYVPVLEVVWVRYALSFVFAVIGLRSWTNLSAYATQRPYVQLLRSTFLLTSTMLNFMAIRTLQLAETGAISFAAPLLVTAFAGPVLGEWAGPRRWAAVIFGFIGVLIVVRPEPGAFQPEALYSVAAAFCYAGYFLTTRLLSATDTPAGMLVYGSALGAFLLAPVLPVIGQLPPTWLVVLALALTGLAAGIGHWCLIIAHRDAPATTLAPFNYTQIVWMVASGYLFFGDVPRWTTLVGGVFIVASGLYILYRERVHRDR